MYEISMVVLLFTDLWLGEGHLEYVSLQQ